MSAPATLWMVLGDYGLVTWHDGHVQVEAPKPVAPASAAHLGALIRTASEQAELERTCWNCGGSMRRLRSCWLCGCGTRVSAR